MMPEFAVVVVTKSGRGGKGLLNIPPRRKVRTGTKGSSEAETKAEVLEECLYELGLSAQW